MTDLRSDTMTTPDNSMRLAMAEAPVGDDVFGEDPTINHLEKATAEMLGKEAALYVPSGTMGNQISIGIQTRPGDEVIVEYESHIFQYEAAAPALISGAQLHCLRSNKGMPPLSDIENAIRRNNVHFPRTALICLENTHNRHSGAIIDLEYIKELRELADRHEIKLHCDGARLWNACAATGISPQDYAEPFHTVSVCFSKALGAPVGSAVVSTKDNIELARRRRKVMGGGMRQAGIIAAGALFALKNNMEYLKLDHENAKIFASKLAECTHLKIDPAAVETNIVVFRHPDILDSSDIEKMCAEQDVIVIPFGPNTLRAVFYYQISSSEADRSGDVIINVINELMDSKK